MSLKAMAWAIEQECGSPSAKVTLWSIANYANPETWCGYPSQEVLADETEQSTDTVQRRIPDLAGRGLIRRIPLRYAGRRSVDFYILAPSRYFAAPLSEIEPLLPRGFIVDPKFCEDDATAICGSGTLPQTLPQPAENVTALLRQHEPVREPRNPERESAGAREAGRGEERSDREDKKPGEERSDREANSPEEEGGQLEDQQPDAPARRRWRKMRADYPGAALDDLAKAERLFMAASEADQAAMIEALPRWIEFLRSQRVRPHLQNFIGDRRWEIIPDPPAAAAPAGEEPGETGIRHFGFATQGWWALVWRLWRDRKLREIKTKLDPFFAAKGIACKAADAPTPAELDGLARIDPASAQFDAWAAHVEAAFRGLNAGVRLPRPDKVPFVWVPAEWPPDVNQAELSEIDGAIG